MINHPLKSGTPDITGTLVVTGASGLTGVYQELRPPAGGLCYMCAGAPAPAGGQKTASVATLLEFTFTLSSQFSYFLLTGSEHCRSWYWFPFLTFGSIHIRKGQKLELFSGHIRG